MDGDNENENENDDDDDDEDSDSEYEKPLRQLAALKSIMDDDEDDEDDEEKEELTLRQREARATNSGGAYTFKLKLVRDEEDPKASHVSVQLFTAGKGGTSDTPKEEKVGYLSGFLLERPNPDFYATADALDGELQQLAVTFCSSNGKANRVKHPHLQKADNCINRGGFFHINLLEIRRAHQGRDLGLRMIHEALSFLGNDWTLAVLIPSTLSRSGCHWPENYRINGGTPRPPATDETPQEKQEIKIGELKLMRHFARMGFVQAFKGDPDRCDAWFLTSNHYFPQGPSNHSSVIDRWLTKAAAEKIDIHIKPEKHVPTGLDKELQKIVGSTGHVKREIHAIADLVKRGASIHGSRLLFLLAASLDADDSRKIFNALVRLGGNVNEPDEFGNTPLHVAACTMKPQAIQYLVRYAGADVQATNLSGNTPLKNFEETLENVQDFNAAFGLPNRKIDVIPKYESYHALMPEYTSFLLIDDWLSPRMRFMIHTTADVIVDQINDSSEYFESNKPLPHSQLVLFMRALEYIPPSVLLSRNPDGFFKSFNDAWQMVFQAIAALVKKGKAPTVQCVGEALWVDVPNFDSQKYQHFLGKGGKIEYALDAVFGITKAVLVTGEEYWCIDSFKDEIEALPSTPLDNAIDVAYIMCINRGGGSLTSHGPYDIFQYHKMSSDDDDGDI